MRLDRCPSHTWHVSPVTPWRVRIALASTYDRGRPRERTVASGPPPVARLPDVP
jgi:hypothetical protein